jgi:pimeloyl-ACP methyl ester carboxylesterase
VSRASTLGCLLIASLAGAVPAAADAPDPATLGESGFVDSGGVPIHYVARGRGPLVVMIHGFPDFWYTWRAQMPALAKSYRVVAIDLRGYNLSGQPEGVEQYTVEKLVADLLAVVDHFQAEKATIVGHDWGGMVAWSFAMAHPDRTERLVVLNLPHPRGLLRELANSPAQRDASAYARGFQQPEAAKNLSADALVQWVHDPGARAIYREAMLRSSIEAMLNYYKANFPREPYPTDRELPPVRCPVLLIHGLKDPALLPGALNDTWKWIDAELTIVTIPGAGHFVQQDAADAVTRTISRWLAP